MRIALVSEGTYPHSVNGVSVWCDQLMQGMPEHEWEMVAITADGTEAPRWAAPRNLRKVHQIPIWGPRPSGRGPTRRPAPEFRSAFAALLASMLQPRDESNSSSAGFLAALRDLHAYAREGNGLTGALRSDAALQLIVEAWREYRDADHAGVMTLADAVNALWLIEHLLRPLSASAPQADLVHSSMNGLSMLVAMTAKWRDGTPIVLTEHGVYLRERYLDQVSKTMPYAVRTLLLCFHRQLACAGYLIADALAPHARHNRRWQIAAGADSRRIWTVYNGVEPTEFPPIEEPDEPTIVYMGRIDPVKDLHTLIRAFAIVRTEIPNARLRMFGDTSAANSAYRNSCTDLIAELEITGAATVEGRVARQVDAYEQGQVVALTSISEGFPYGVVEAMACGRPTVCTDVGGVAEAVGDAGLIVSARDHQAVATACVRLLRDGELRLRLGARARERVLENFTLAGSLEVYRTIYDALTRNHSPEPRGGTHRRPDDESQAA